MRCVRPWSTPPSTERVPLASQPVECITESDLIRWSEALAAIARSGLGVTESLYEQERYEEGLAVAADMRVAAGRGTLDPSALVQEWMKGAGDGALGYVTPKVAVGAVVGNDDGEILLIQRADSGVWLYPTGWADIGYSPAEVAVKEVGEETGIIAEVESFVAVFDGLRRGFSAVPLYSLMFKLRPVGGSLARHPLECLDVGWFDRDSLPDPLAGAGNWVDIAFQAIDAEAPIPYFDPPRSDVWIPEGEPLPPADRTRVTGHTEEQTHG